MVYMSNIVVSAHELKIVNKVMPVNVVMSAHSLKS